MKISYKGRAILLGDAEPGSVLGWIDEHNQYVRFLKTTSGPDDQTTIIAIGPYLDASDGPFPYLWDNDTRMLQDDAIELSPKSSDSDGKPIPPKKPRFKHAGGIYFGPEGELLLCVRADRRAGRAFIDVRTGQIVKVELHEIPACFDSYVLIGLNELQRRTILFDSSKAIPSPVEKVA